MTALGTQDKSSIPILYASETGERYAITIPIIGTKTTWVKKPSNKLFGNFITSLNWFIDVLVPTTNIIQAMAKGANLFTTSILVFNHIFFKKKTQNDTITGCLNVQLGIEFCYENYNIKN